MILELFSNKLIHVSIKFACVLVWLYDVCFEKLRVGSWIDFVMMVFDELCLYLERLYMSFRWILDAFLNELSCFLNVFRRPLSVQQAPSLRKSNIGRWLNADMFW